MARMHRGFVVFYCIVSLCFAGAAYSEGNGWEDLSSSKEDTYITSRKVVINVETNEFSYRGSVVLRRGDMVLNSDRLDGRYNEKQGIDEMVATGNVSIEKGKSIKAVSQRAVYNKEEETMVLTEGPQVEENGSVLMADMVTILLRENKSLAEGNVRIRLLEGK
ncbi:MAG: hypothetical protein D6808_07595 [Candidatus Dadabacteria bacterium]|nr:MAG: hypothetical protein D6808_07595 [Candidatus Dadabacteria bacterium]